MDDPEKGMDGRNSDESPASHITDKDVELRGGEKHSEALHDVVEKDQPHASGTPASDQRILVDWDGPDDPEHPQNFTRSRKFIITCTAGGLTLCVTWSSSIFSAATFKVAEEFHVSPEVTILGTSLYILGFGLGPTIFGPFSELYGRRIPLFVGIVGFAIFQIPVGVATNLQTILVCRFFQGLFGCSPTAVVGGILADMWNPRERGFAMPTFAGTLFAGPVCAPIITLIMTGLFAVPALFLISETFYPVLLAKRAKRLRRETGNSALYAKHEDVHPNFYDLGRRYISRPLNMVFHEPILAFVTVYLSFVYGLIYLFFESYPIAFQQYRRWSAGVASLPFLSILVGVLGGCVLMALTTKTRLSPDPANGRPIESRLLLMIVASILLPIGLFWFAWTSFPFINPWPEIIAGVPIGFAVILITLQGFNYLIDVYTIYANSAIAATIMLRSIFGAVFPLFATYMYNGLEVPWATSVLAFVSVPLIPVSILFYKYGAKIRSWSKFVIRND